MNLFKGSQRGCKHQSKSNLILDLVLVPFSVPPEEDFCLIPKKESQGSDRGYFFLDCFDHEPKVSFMFCGSSVPASATNVKVAQHETQHNGSTRKKGQKVLETDRTSTLALHSFVD